MKILHGIMAIMFVIGLLGSMACFDRGGDTGPTGVTYGIMTALPVGYFVGLYFMRDK